MIPVKRHRLNWLALLPAVSLFLAACGSAPPRPTSTSSGAGAPRAVKMLPSKRGGGYYKDDGPGELIPDNLDEIPDASPRWEPLNRFTNRPYVVLGKEYVPMTQLRPFRQEGIASWYGKKFHGQKTSTGEPYDMFGMSAAHPTLPLPSYVRVTNPANGRSVVVRVNDRGPFHADRIIDLSYTAAYKLGYVDSGSSPVIVESILPGDVGGTSYADVAPPSRDEADLESLSQKLFAEDARPDSTPPAANPAGGAASGVAHGIFLQLGAFASRENAENLRNHLSRDLDWLSEPIRIESQGNIHRLRLGPYASRAEAARLAERIRLALGQAPTLVSQ